MANISASKKKQRPLTLFEKQVRKWEYTHNFESQSEVYRLKIKQDKKHLKDIDKILGIMKRKGLGIGKSPVYEELLTRVNLITGDIKAMERGIKNNATALKNAHRIVDGP